MPLIEYSPNNPIDFSYQFYQNPPLIEFAKKKFNCNGILLKTIGKDNPAPYYYLKVKDDFIHALFPLLEDNTLLKPDYFATKNSTGAHISVFYPEEISSNVSSTEDFSVTELNQTFNFDLFGLIDIQVFGKRIVALAINSLELETLRIQYGFPKKLNYHGLLVPFHITLAINIREA